jgi:hypothetical protein
MDEWLKDILPDKDPYHNRGRDQMRKKGGPEFECLCRQPNDKYPFWDNFQQSVEKDTKYSSNVEITGDLNVDFLNEQS